MTTTEARGRILFPPGVDGWAHISPLHSPLWARPGAEWARNGQPINGTLYRRTITRESPIRFALTYLPGFITNRRTKLISLSDAHLAMARSALQWMYPHPQRDAWVLPRGGAKTTWLYVILPAWALAHGHRKFFLSFAWTKEQAEGHLAKLRHQLDVNERLLGDFPELRKVKGAGTANTKATVTVSGATLAARGLKGTTLGISDLDAQRPDLIIGDDLQPEPEDHSPEIKRAIESRVVHGILPMGDETTVVTLAGTTTMAGCLMDDVVRATLPTEHKDYRVADWVSAHHFRPHYFPAILDEGLPTERSLWPSRWSLAELHERQEADPQDYAFNYSNRPEEAGIRGYWTRELIRYDTRIQPVRRLLYADVAMSRKARSDLTALVLLGVDASGRYAIIEHAEMCQMPGRELVERFWALTAAYPETLHEWWVEGNQGCEEWFDTFGAVPAGVKLDIEYVGAHKADRIIWALAQYQRRAVFHRHPLVIEDQMVNWTPSSKRDDGMDALAGALRKAKLVGAGRAVA